MLRSWIRRAERDQGKHPGLTTEDRQRLRTSGPAARPEGPAAASGGHCAACRRPAFPPLPQLADAVDPAVLPPHRSDVTAERVVPARAPRPPVGPPLTGPQVLVQRRADRQHRADRLDPRGGPVLVDEAHHHFVRRSSSAWAKYAAAFLRNSLAHRSLTFSLSSCLRAVHCLNLGCTRASLGVRGTPANGGLSLR
jgi:hypothetical protein